MSPSVPALTTTTVRALALAATLALALAATPGDASQIAPSTSESGAHASVTTTAAPGVVERRVLGRSARGRPIEAWRLGEPDAATTVVLISTMHGDEPATRGILTSLRDGVPVRGIDLWVVPTYNPDGLARGTRASGRGVDLNRNYPYRWAPLDGRYESGPRPASEPETRAMMRFLRAVRPDRLLSFHQPLNGVDTDTKSPAFARRVARTLRLPSTTLDCGGVCHGTMTGWFNATFPGVALTVEYPARPGRRRMTQVAPAQVLQVFRARYARLVGEPAGEYPGARRQRPR